MSPGPYRVGQSWGVTIIHDPNPNPHNKTGTLWATAQTPEYAQTIVTALNNQPTPTPTPTTVHYGRYLYEPDPTDITTQTNRWTLQILQGDPWHQQQKTALTTHPGTLTLRFASTLTRRPNDPPGDSQSLPPSQIPNTWMLHDTTGNIITRTRNNDQLVDPGNPNYQQAAATFLLGRCTTENWDGVWLDEINADPRWSYPPNMPAKYPTLTTWQTALTQYIQTITTTLTTHGYQVWANLAGNYGDTWTTTIANTVTGTGLEYYIAGGNPPLATLQNGRWQQQTHWQTNQPRGHYNAQTTNPAAIRYALATYLLFNNSTHSTFGAGIDPYPVNKTMWTTDMETARKLGTPLATYTTKAGIYQRHFEHGDVTVNPSEQATNGMPPTSATITTH